MASFALEFASEIDEGRVPMPNLAVQVVELGPGDVENLLCHQQHAWNGHGLRQISYIILDD